MLDAIVMLAPHPRINDVTSTIIGAAIEIHRALGPGLLESAYQACLTYELLALGRPFEAKKPLPLTYKGVQLDCGYILDFVVEDLVVVEIKCVACIRSSPLRPIADVSEVDGLPCGAVDQLQRPRLEEWNQAIAETEQMISVTPFLCGELTP